MFSLHETKRRRLCRTMFFVLCVAPTLATLAFVGAKLRPGRDGRWSRAASARLLTPVSISGAQELRPGVVQCDAATISARRDQPVLHFEDLRGQFAAAGERLHAGRLELRLEHLSAAVALAEQWLADGASDGQALIERVTLTHRAEDPAEPRSARWTLRNVRINSTTRLVAGESLRELIVQGAITVPAHDGQQRQFHIQLAIRRASVRRLAVHVTIAASAESSETEATQFAATVECLPAFEDCDDRLEIVVDDPTLSLPGAVLAGWPGFGDAELLGTLRLTLHAGEPAGGSFVGRVDGFQPAALLADADLFDGTASLSSFEMQWTPAGCVASQGEVQLQGAETSRALARRAAMLWCTPLGAAASELTESEAGLLTLDRLAFGFQLLADGKLTIYGRCGPAGDTGNLNAVAVRNGRPWLREPEFEQIHESTWRGFLNPLHEPTASDSQNDAVADPTN